MAAALVTGAQYVGAGMCLLLLLALCLRRNGASALFFHARPCPTARTGHPRPAAGRPVLRGDIDRLEHDPARIEQLARERLGYVRKGETVYQLVPDRSEERVATMKFGTVAIVGRSNVGKSTLLNRLLNEKIAIVSEKPQTTRTRILGVVHAPGAQIALLDTPGLHKPQHLLNRRMVRTAVETLEEADLLFVLMDATSLPGPGDLLVLDHVKAALKKRPRPVILVLNKVDLVNKMKLLPVIETYARIVCLDGSRAGVGPDGR